MMIILNIRRFQFNPWIYLLLFCTLICLTSTTAVNSKDHTEIYEQHASELLAKSQQEMQQIYDRNRDIFLKRNLNSGQAMEKLAKEYNIMVRNLAAKLSTIPVSKLKNETLRRQVKRLAKLQLRGLNENDFQQAENDLKEMNKLLTTDLVCELSRNMDCSKSIAMVPNIQMHLLHISNYDSLNYYWTNWRQKINEKNKARDLFKNYIKYLRKAAMYNGHVTPSRTWYLHYETENFQKELEDVIWEIMPLYKELHAYLRHTARNLYGKGMTNSDGALPASVLEQMIHQAWFVNASTLEEPYPAKKLPDIRLRIEEILEEKDKMPKKAAEFFESLGFNEMPTDFFKTYARPWDAAENVANCKSEIYYFPPEVGLRYCSKLTYKRLMQIHGNMAELQYNLYKRNLPFGLDTEPCPGFSSAIGETAVIASGTPRHLYQLSVLLNDSLDIQTALNRQFRMAVHTVLAIPQYFINDKFVVEVLDGHIENKNLNCGYWDLQYKYAGVNSPYKRNETFFDPDNKFYKGLIPAKSSTMKFISEVLGMQLYRAFCLASNSYQPGNPKYPLHNCDYYGNTKVGNTIKEVMKLGATKHWRDILQIATGSRKLSGIGVIEYFAPLFIWLKKNNRELGLDVGWNSKSKCLRS